MNIDSCCQHLQSRLQEKSLGFKDQLRAVTDRDGYANAISELVPSVLKDGPAHELWIERCGLVYCAAFVPSVLFAAPIKILFSPASKAGVPTPPPLRWTRLSPWGDPLFTRKLFSLYTAIEMRFGTTSSQTGNALRRKGLIEIPQEALDCLFTYRSWRKKPDPRLAPFLQRNEPLLSKVLDIHGPECCLALDEINDIRKLLHPKVEYVYLVPCSDGLSAGLMFFFSRNSISPRYRPALRFFSQLLFDYTQAMDRHEFQRRTTLAESALSVRHSHFHAIRTHMGTVQNYLQMLERKVGRTGKGANRSIVQCALDAHSQVLRHLDGVETAALAPSQLDNSLASITTLEKQLEDRCPPKSRRWLMIAPLHDPAYGDPELLEIPGSTEELVEAIYAFIDGSLKRPRPRRTKSPGSNFKAWVMIGNDDSTLRFHIRNDLPYEMWGVIQSTNILDRLPSLKSWGGRGILSAIELLRARYRATCRFNDDYWVIEIPIVVTPQMRLF